MFQEEEGAGRLRTDDSTPAILHQLLHHVLGFELGEQDGVEVLAQIVCNLLMKFIHQVAHPFQTTILLFLEITFLPGVQVVPFQPRVYPIHP